MKSLFKPLFLALLLAGLPTLGQASLAFSWSGAQEILDNDLSGSAFPFTLSDPATAIANVTVTLNLSGGYNGDLYAYLSHGSGFAVLLNRVGRSASNEAGYGDSGFDAIFSGSASADIHIYQSLGPSYLDQQLIGTWAADGRNLDPASAPAVFEAAVRDAPLTSFNGLDPNGAWTLCIADCSSGETSTLNSFSVEVTAVPEPAETGAIVAGLLLTMTLWRERLRRAQG